MGHVLYGFGAHVLEVGLLADAELAVEVGVLDEVAFHAGRVFPRLGVGLAELCGELGVELEELLEEGGSDFEVGSFGVHVFQGLVEGPRVPRVERREGRTSS